jgi:hypothetical protein
MSLKILLLVVLIVTALLIYAVDMIPLVPPFGNLIKVLIIVLAAAFIASRAGLF